MQPFDCERINDGLLAQPVNSVSSLAFLAAAGLLWVRGYRLEASVMTVAGMGSVWFHAAPSAAGQWLHDIGLYAAIAVAAVSVWRRLAASDPPFAAAGVFGIGVVVWFVSRTDGALCDPDALLQGHALWHILAATAFVVLIAPTDDQRGVPG